MRHERGCEMGCLCAMSEAYDQNNQVPIVVLCASGGKQKQHGSASQTAMHSILSVLN